MTTRKTLENLLKEIDFSESEICVYLALTRLGEAKASAVAKKADLPRTTVGSILEKLADRRVLTTHHYHGTTYYWVESPETLAQLFEQKTAVANRLGALLRDAYRSEAHFPTAEIIDTKSRIKRYIESLIGSLAKGSIIRTIDTPQEGNYAKIFSEAYETLFLGWKRRRGAVTHTLIPHGSFRDVPRNKLAAQEIVLRELPAGIEFSGSLWLLEKTLVHFSGNPPFLASMRQESIVSGMSSLYDFLWNSSASISQPRRT